MAYSYQYLCSIMFIRNSLIVKLELNLLKINFVFENASKYKKKKKE